MLRAERRAKCRAAGVCASITLAAGAAVAGCGGAASGSARTSTTSTPASLPSLVARSRNAVIRIETTTCDGGEIGSGFLVGPRLVATVEHVVDGATHIELKRNGRVLGSGVVIGEDPTRDVALVRASAPIRGPALELSASSPELGQSVAALGFPLGLALTVTQGAVSGLGRTIPINGIQRRDLVQTDAAVNPGNSGGPLLSLAGQVVGLVDLDTTAANGIGFAVSSRVAAPLLQVWRDTPQPTPPTRCSATSTQSTSSAATTAPTTAGPSSAVPTYNGQAFSVDYPQDWIVEAAEQQHSWGTDTVIASPDSPSTTLIRVDVSTNPPSTDPRVFAAPVIAALEKQHGYGLIDLSGDTVDGYPALHWEFVVDENGVLLHKEDEFFYDTDNGDSGAILTQAPASEYQADAAAFAAVRGTLVMF